MPGSRYGSIDHNIAVRSTIEADLSSAVTVTVSGHYNDYTGQESGAATFGAKVPGSSPAVRCSTADILASLCVNSTGFRDPHPTAKKVYGDLARQPQSINSYGGWFKVTADLGFANLTSLTSYDRATKRNRWDSDRSPTGRLDFETAVEHEQQSQELRLDGETGPVKFQVGGYYYGDKRFFTGTLAQLGGLGSFADQKIRTLGAFAQATFAVTNTFNLTGGIRYIDDQRDLVRLVRVGSGGKPLQRVGTPSVFNGQPFDISRKFKDNKVTYRAAFDWHFTPDNMLYGSVSTGYKSAGFNTNLPSPNPALVVPTAPETITAYEAGIKGDLLGRRLSYNIAGFDMKYRDFQAQGTIIPNPAVSQTPVSILFNVGGVFEQCIARQLPRNMAMFARKVWRDHPLARLVRTRPARDDVERAPHCRNHHLQVHRVGIVIHVDRGRRRWIGAEQHNFALAARQFELDDKIDIFRLGAEHSVGVSGVQRGVHIELIADQARIDTPRHETDLRVMAVTRTQPRRKECAGIVPR